MVDRLVTLANLGAAARQLQRLWAVHRVHRERHLVLGQLQPVAASDLCELP
jgi:hypothetical protein